ncbi:uncharacterized protein [Dysidea avara]|uniref:uncharacterized protein n=1 Tax=Dysidea avara TaxID=196820 RepID=UPI00331E2330
MEGILDKYGCSQKGKWQSRYVVLKDTKVYYYSRQGDEVPLGCLDICRIEKVVGGYSGKEHCFAICTLGGEPSKVHYISAETRELHDEWHKALQKATLPKAIPDFTEYAVVEIFGTQGVRVTGNVSLKILSILSGRAAPEKKRIEEKGWYCDADIPVSLVLNAFSSNGWKMEKIFPCTSVTALDHTLSSAVKIVFSLSPTLKHSANQLAVPQIRSICGSMSQLPLPPKDMLLEGTDEELIALMKEFHIPLTLLRKDSVPV